MEAQEVLDTSVAITKKEGVITLFTVVEYPSSLKKSFEVLLPETKDYAKAVEIADKLRQQGTPIGAIDILIAAMCLNRSAKLITKDNDFSAIKKLYPTFQLELQ